MYVLGDADRRKRKNFVSVLSEIKGLSHFRHIGYIVEYNGDFFIVTCSESKNSRESLVENFQCVDRK